MTLDAQAGYSWIRKHDPPQAVRIAPTIVRAHGLADLIELCRRRPFGTGMHAAGSHWALSEAAASDNVFIETHDPNGQYPAMGRTLREVVPGCMNAAVLQDMAAATPASTQDPGSPEDQPFYYVHVETGKRIHQLYAELDFGEENEAGSLSKLLVDGGHAGWAGPWAFRTLGGAGGQTVFGAVNTGTHGGDHAVPPIADDVVALHLVADGGRQYWIEPNPESSSLGRPLTDDAKLRALYEPYGDFEIVRDDEMFDAALVSVGRFGVVYSVVLRAVRQYQLREERVLDDWQHVREEITRTGANDEPASTLYGGRFLQVVVCLTPYENWGKNRCGVTTRVIEPLPTDGSAPFGRAERVGDRSDDEDPLLGAYRFSNAGNSMQTTGSAASFLELACNDADFIEGVIRESIAELQHYTTTGTVAAGTALASLFVPGVAATWFTTQAIIAVLAILEAFLSSHFSSGSPPTSRGKVVNELKDHIFGLGEALRPVSVLVWHLIGKKIFEKEQSERVFTAVSYAIMDQHNYLDRSCDVNADSIEIFFDATSPLLPVFVDQLIAYEIAQEAEGLTFLGYVSLRFTGRTRALLGEQQWEKTCAMEIAGLADVTGTTKLIDYAIELSKSSTYNGILHWGQRNDPSAALTEGRFGQTASPASLNLRAWRGALSRVTDGGQLAAFSSPFTRAAGLEVV